MAIYLMYQTLWDDINAWIATNLTAVFISVISVLLGYIFYKLIAKQFKKLELNKRIEAQTGKNLERIIKIVIVLLILGVVLGQFWASITILTSLLPIIAGTIFGFAAMNTLGNLIAGIIIMTSKPFVVGDRIHWDNRMADVVEITLMFTILEDLDLVKIVIPNQKLLTTDINNLGKHDPIRRSITITMSYDEDLERVEKILLESVKEVKEVLTNPEPYVWVTGFQNYAVEVKVFAFVSAIKRIRAIDAALHRAVLLNCKKHNIGIITPMVIRQL